MEIVKASLTLIPTRDVILPPVTSKVLKYLIMSGELFPFLRDLVSSRDKHKPLFISNLGVNGRRLVLMKPVHVSRGTALDAFISYPLRPDAITPVNGVFNTPYGEFQVTLNSFMVLDEFQPPQGNVVRVNFVSPVLLSSMIGLPPSLNPRFRGRGSNFTIPSPGLIIASAYKTHQGLTRRFDDVKSFKLAVLVNALSKVINFRMRPVTVSLGERGDKVRKTRGVKGWIEFELPPEFRGTMKYLMVGSYLGIGRSRGIGLGEISLEVKDLGASSKADLSGEQEPRS
ncbi:MULTISPECIES: CRISPR system precrRNA processing endoribonuclease RAMP protein Cas6 [Metallosphaera]|uniref:CRISPR-associated protein Cas6 C-terminal domain-containing protein n=3 Tax=Metallosphaera TaxID=41980 RepID=A4YFW1_METS5|nr:MULTISPECIES: CRISPR system precrRNA processing endoribonuclease RAMP protein Cas6 [Metallosphaera]ABP95313.1 hypothetical protein Msed_1152 [Metallosphaera sedula DSM 5348]AIM27299.1 hypothetical protein HA72_1152 [Metallosphaera sedula]AKV74185.1 hypothetical protein MsedA_1169 [Metallosphaera sedula]AKV76424.1 hypothetical protein MsedB_1171 [Metallosphaera sedula]AKV78676.1 hypothetical protein MsedC_1169 [Metallosphaera sedula]